MLVLSDCKDDYEYWPKKIKEYLQKDVHDRSEKLKGSLEYDLGCNF